jgi:hypothetical protein
MKFKVKSILPPNKGLYYGPLGLGLTSAKFAQIFDSEDIEKQAEKGSILPQWWSKNEVRLIPVGDL